MPAHLNLLSPPQPPFAILDLDGTLMPGALGADLLAHLAETGVADPEHACLALTALERYRCGHDTLTPAATATYTHYAAALKGQRYAAVEQAAAHVWAMARRQLFTFTRPLLQRLNTAGLHCILISGSPEEVVRLAAADLAIPHVRATTAELSDGRYTGSLTAVLGLPGGKLAALAALGIHPTTQYDIAFAIGNSISDAEIFHRTIHPIAFEPDAQLAELAAHEGWTIARRHDVLDTIDRSILPR